jgi:hypothetical protein
MGIEAPCVTMDSALENIKPLPNVTIKAGTLAYAISTPFHEPISTPASRVIEIAVALFKPAFVTKYADNAPKKPVTAPTDKSNFPAIRQNDIPIDNMPTMETCQRRFEILLKLINEPSAAN